MLSTMIKGFLVLSLAGAGVALGQSPTPSGSQPGGRSGTRSEITIPDPSVSKFEEITRGSGKVYRAQSDIVQEALSKADQAIAEANRRFASPSSISIELNSTGSGSSGFPFVTGFRQALSAAHYAPINMAVDEGSEPEIRFESLDRNNDRVISKQEFEAAGSLIKKPSPWSPFGDSTRNKWATISFPRPDLIPSVVSEPEPKPSDTAKAAASGAAVHLSNPR